MPESRRAWILGDLSRRTPALQGGFDMALTLSRREEEVILIGGDIEVMVVKIKGEKVCLAISAPKEVRILRKELAKELAEEEP
jgi:carbon storage regulator